MANLLQARFPSLRDQVGNAFLLSYNRPATPMEIDRSIQFLREFDLGEPPVVEPAALPGPGRDRDSMKGKGKKGNQSEPAPTAETTEPVSPEAAKLAALCQALMMSAEFRTIH